MLPWHPAAKANSTASTTSNVALPSKVTQQAQQDSSFYTNATPSSPAGAANVTTNSNDPSPSPQQQQQQDGAPGTKQDSNSLYLSGHDLSNKPSRQIHANSMSNNASTNSSPNANVNANTMNSLNTANQQLPQMPQPPIPPSSTAAPSMPSNMSLTHILHFLQQEFRRFDRDRNEWEIERGEMRARIALLEGERRGNENARNDLLRRVKMLEFALKGERSKYLSLSSAQAQLQIQQANQQMQASSSKDSAEKTQAGTNDAADRAPQSRNEEQPQAPSSVVSSQDQAGSSSPVSSNAGDAPIPSLVIASSSAPRGNATNALSALPAHLQFNNLARESPMIISRPNSALGLAAVGDKFSTANFNAASATLAGDAKSGTGIGIAGFGAGGITSGGVAGWNPALGRDPRGRARSRDYLKQCLQEISYLTSTTTLNPLPETSSNGISRPRKVMVSLPSTQSQNANAPSNPSSDSGQLPATNAGQIQQGSAPQEARTSPPPPSISTAPILPSLATFTQPAIAPVSSTAGMRSTATTSAAMASVSLPAPSLISFGFTTAADETKGMSSEPSSQPEPFVDTPTGPKATPEPQTTPSFSSDDLVVDELSTSSVPNGILPPLPVDSTSRPPPTPTSPMKDLPSLEPDPFGGSGEGDDEVFAGDAPDSGKSTAIFRPTDPAAWKAQLKEANERSQRQQQQSQGEMISLPDDGELANLSLATAEEEAASNQVNGSAGHNRTTDPVWQSRRILRSHMDAVRCVAFARSSDLMLASAGDDMTVKIWRLHPHTLGPISTRMSTIPESEPQVTLRGHSAGITCLAISAAQDRIFSGSLDQTIRCWAIPPPQRETYAPFDVALKQQIFEGHTDAIWDIAVIPLRIQGESLLASASADGTVKVWSVEHTSSPLKLSWRYYGTASEESVPNGVAPVPAPTAVCVCHYDYRRLGVAYQNAVVKIFDIENGSELLSLKSDQSYDGTPATQINALATHPTLPILVTAHEDRYIRMFDLTTGECTKSVLAHEDAVTAIDIDPAGLHLVSAGHDCSLRFWDLLATQTCLQEMAMHRPKAEEGILGVRYHPSLPYVASAGADGCCRIYSL